MSVWYLYLVRCCDGSIYTGITTDVNRRMAAHRAGRGARYVRGRGPLELVFSAKIGSRSLALQAERRVKKLPSIRKRELANSCIDWLRAGDGDTP